jgi:hypothetical protein
MSLVMNELTPMASADITQRVLHIQFVLVFAQDQANGRLVVCGTQLIVHGGQIEIEFADVLRLNPPAFCEL